MCGPTESRSWYDDWTKIKSEKFEPHGTELELEKGAKNRSQIKKALILCLGKQC